MYASLKTLPNNTGTVKIPSDSLQLNLLKAHLLIFLNSFIFIHFYSWVLFQCHFLTMHAVCKNQRDTFIWTHWSVILTSLCCKLERHDFYCKKWRFHLILPDVLIFPLLLSTTILKFLRFLTSYFSSFKCLGETQNSLKTRVLLNFKINIYAMHRCYYYFHENIFLSNR